ncbi:MAG: hypothetical protein HY273_05995 [Gammaproteobacteria bacterium]|nr:hypothetical protein [Gammaproteobacteria bacterium]
MSKKTFVAGLFTTPDENEPALNDEHSFYYNHSSVRRRDPVKPSIFWRRLWGKLLWFSVFTSPVIVTCVIAGRLAAALLAAWEFAMMLVVLMMMGARLCSVVKEGQ